MAEIF